MNLATSGSPGAFVNISKYILKPWGFIRTCRNSRNMFSNFRKSWSVCKYLEKYSEAWEFLGLVEIQEMWSKAAQGQKKLITVIKD